MKKFITTLSILFLALLSNQLIAQVNCNAIHLKPVGKTSLNCGDSSNLYAYINNDWEVKANNLGINLKSVFFTSATVGYCVGTGGLILKTTDAGASWVAKNSGTTNKLNSIWFTNASIGIAVGDNGTIIKTTDGGETWAPISSLATTNLNSVQFLNSTRVYICGDLGATLKSKDGGNTWTGSTGYSGYNFYSNFYIADTLHPCVVGSYVYGGGDYGAIFFDSLDASGYLLGWLVQNENYEYTSFYSTFATNTLTCYSVGNMGLIFKRNGFDRRIKASNITTDLFSVFFPSTLIGYSVGQNGTIIKTIDSAFTWSTQNSGTNQDLNSVCFVNNTLGFAVGNNKTIIKTTDGGLNWQSIGGNTNTLSSLYFTDTATGYAVGDKGTILKTSDTANTWQPKTSGTKANLKGIHFLNTTTGIAVGDSGKIAKTTSSGNTWSLQTSGTATNLKSVYMISGFYCVAVGDNGKLIRSTDGGFSWGNITSNTSNTLNSVFFSGTNNGYAVGNGGVFIKSLDAGLTWSVGSSGVTNNLNSVYFPTPTIGYAVGSGGKIIKTINSGTSWVSLSSGVANNLLSVYFKDAYTGYAVGDNGKIISTVNGGETWVQEISNTTYSLGAVFMVNNYSFAAGANGIILRNKAIDMNSNYYLWQPAIGLSDQNIYNPVAKPLSTTTYSVTVLQGNGCPPMTDSIKITVAQLVVDATGGQIINCGDSVQLGVTQNFTNNSYTYSWSPTQGLNNPNIKTPKASPAVTTDYKVTVSTNNGCGSPKDSTIISLTPMSSTPLCLVSVINNKNKLIWDKPIETAIDSFYIYRETTVTNVYQKIGATSYNDSSVFIDNNSNADIQSNKYQISIKDKCLLESPKSSAHKTMHLTINQGMGTTWNLIWEPYEGFTVSTYRILRGTTPSNLTLIGTTSGSSTQYTDNTAPAGYIYYQLEVISPILCNPAKSINTSVSNIATNNPITNITEQNSLGSISIYPNPVRNELIIEIEGNNETINFEIYNSLGQVVYKGNLIEKTVVQTNGFTPGVYLIKLDNNKSFEFRKIIKE